jgi:uncharacterized membrane protein (Fun14 family)
MTASGSDLTPRQTATRNFSTWLGEMPRWKKVALGAALSSAVIGGVLSLLGDDPQPLIDNTTTNQSGLQASLIETRPGVGTTGNQEPPPEPASKGFFRLGFGFLAGFCIGTFLRAVLKLAAIVVGFWLFATLLLSYVDLVEVRWDQIDSLWNQFFANIDQEWGNFQSFMLGSLPTTGLAVTGLAVGLKRH